MSTLLASELAQAQRHVDSALAKLNAASAAVGAARTEEVRLAGELADALAAEKAAAENGDATAELTVHVRDAQDAARVFQYRIKKLETESALAQADYSDAFRVLQHFELQAAHVNASAAADAFEATLTAAADAKRLYTEKLAAVRGRTVNTPDYQPDNIARIIRWSVTLHLLGDGELFSGRDGFGKPIESAPDIRKIIGGDRMPLLR